MAQVTGIGGIFFKSRDPAALGRWYQEALGVEIQSWGGAQFFFGGANADGYAVWSPFSWVTDYFSPSEKPYMVNLRVDDLDGILARLREAGATVLERREDTEQGRFGYVMDPEGTLIELWEPSPNDPCLAGRTP